MNLPTLMNLGFAASGVVPAVPETNLGHRSGPIVASTGDRSGPIVHGGWKRSA